MSAQPIAIHRVPVSEPAYQSVNHPVLYLVPPREQPELPGATELSGDDFTEVYDREYYARQAVEANLPGALENYFGPQRTPTRALPDATALAHTYCRAVAEILTGFRPLAQIKDNTSAQVFEWLGEKVSGLQRDRRRPLAPTVHCVRVCEPADGVVEVCAVVKHGPRARAIAARFHGIDEAWRCVQLHII